MDRQTAFRLMKKNTVPGIEKGTSIYGIETESMNEEELKVALYWTMTQLARLSPPSAGLVGVQGKPH